MTTPHYSGRIGATVTLGFTDAAALSITDQQASHEVNLLSFSERICAMLTLCDDAWSRVVPDSLVRIW